jgi:conjugal transfer/entry exclusion protein
MASKATNPITRLKENILGTPEQNRAAQERMDATAKKKKEKEKETATEEKTKMAKGGSVKKKVPTKMAKGGKATKTPVLAIMIGVPKAKKK